MATLRICDKNLPLALGSYISLLFCPSGWHTARAEEAPADSGAVERQSGGGRERRADCEMLFQLFPNSLQSPSTVNYSISGYLSRASGG